MPEAERPTLGGREVNENRVNAGLLRCPRCMSRLVSKCGELRELQGLEAKLWVPSNKQVGEKPVSEENVAEAASSTSVVSAQETAPQELPTSKDDAYSWAEKPYTFWWMVGSMDDVDNLGLSRVVQSPRGPLKLAMCCECQYGPVGHQFGEDPRIWLACDLLHQQDAALANNAEDFPLPQGVDLGMLQQMIESGMATVQFHVTFEQQRLGMCLADADEQSGGGVAVVAFTDMGDGSTGPAELSGQIKVGDRLSRVNGKSTAGLDYTGVLDMVIEASRPVTITFERRGRAAGGDVTGEGGVARVTHEQWKEPPPPTVN